MDGRANSWFACGPRGRPTSIRSLSPPGQFEFDDLHSRAAPDLSFEDLTGGYLVREWASGVPGGAGVGRGCDEGLLVVDEEEVAAAVGGDGDGLDVLFF